MYIRKFYKKKVALIFGITGQDGAYLSKLLLDKKYKVIGTSRHQKANLINLKKIGVNKNIKIVRLNPKNKMSVKKLLSSTIIDEIYYFSGISSVSYSHKFPEKTLYENTIGLINILESCRAIKRKIKIYNASSSECFGSSLKKINEKSNFSPVSPYALSKVINSLLIKNYRDNLKIWAVNGYSFNHDSILRPKHFILKKIANYLKSNKKKKLNIGNINIKRDWGLASEHIGFIYKIMQLRTPEDFVIGTGKSESLKSVINFYFKKYKIKQNNLKINKKYIRKNDIMFSTSDPRKIKKIFDRKPNSNAKIIIDKMINGKF